MSKKTKRLEKENVALTRIKETGNRNIIEMAEDKQKRDLELETMRKKCLKLENLCRALQQERKLPSIGTALSANGAHDASLNAVVAQAEAELRAAEEAAAKAARELDDEETESDYGYEDGEEEDEEEEYEDEEDATDNLAADGSNGHVVPTEGPAPLKPSQPSNPPQSGKVAPKVNGVGPHAAKGGKPPAVNGVKA